MADQADIDECFMREALGEARLALQTADVPVGAVLVVEGAIIARGHNQRQALADPTAHAEVLVLREAAHYLRSWRLTGATLYVTLEPCIMCIGAAILGRIERLVFGCYDPKAGACGSQFDILGVQKLNHSFSIVSGICQKEASALLKAFFRELRGKHTEAPLEKGE